MRDRTNPDDFPDPNAPDVIDLDTSALPLWQQRMDAGEGAPVEQGLDDICPVVADAPPSQPRAPSRLLGQSPVLLTEVRKTK